MKDIEDEIPFDLPDGWAWASLSQIAELFTGNSINETEKATKYANVEEGYNYIATKDVGFDCSINYRNGIRIPFAETKFKLAPKESTLLCIEGGSAGRKIGFTSEDVCFVNKLCCFKSRAINNLFIFYYLQSNSFLELFNAGKGGLIGGVSLNTLKSLFIPIPPLAEQEKICININDFLSNISSLEQDQSSLQLVIKQTKSKILDLAIHGKLVPQDPSDEPASVLLEKIRAEKEAKIKAGELKRDKNDSYIYKNTTDNCYYQKFSDGNETDISDEIPFDLPETWNWCNLSEIADKVTDGEHNTPRRVDSFKGFYLLSARNIQNGYIALDDVDYVDEQEFNRISGRCNPQRNDILISCSGSIGRCTRIEDDNKYVMVRSAAMISAHSINTKYLMYVIQSTVLQNQIQNVSKQTAQANLFQGAIINLHIPLPPLAEQKRIVEKIENAFNKLDQITEQLD